MSWVMNEIILKFLTENIGHIKHRKGRFISVHKNVVSPFTGTTSCICSITKLLNSTKIKVKYSSWKKLMELILIICEGKRGVFIGLQMYEEMNRMEQTSPFGICKRLTRRNYSNRYFRHEVSFVFTYKVNFLR